MKPALAVALLALAASSAALAQDPPAKAPAAPPPKDGVEVKLAAKPATVLRFRRTASSGLQIGRDTIKNIEQSWDYTVRVKSARPDGGLDVAVTVESIRMKAQHPPGPAIEIDTSKPALQGLDAETAKSGDIFRAMTGRPFTVTLDAHGAAIAVQGLREVVIEGLRGTQPGSVDAVNKEFDDPTCLRLVGDMFESSPAAPLAVGGKSSGAATHEVSGWDLEFGVERTLSAATDDVATVDSKFTLRPSGAATGSGDGTSQAKFSRKDGFVLLLKRNLEKKGEVHGMKATSHAEWTIERLPEAPAKAPATK